MHPHSTGQQAPWAKSRDILGAPHLRTREGFEGEMEPQDEEAQPSEDRGWWDMFQEKRVRSETQSQGPGPVEVLKLLKVTVFYS